MLTIIAFGVGLFLGIYLGYLSGKNDGRLMELEKRLR